MAYTSARVYESVVVRLNAPVIQHPTIYIPWYVPPTFQTVTGTITEDGLPADSHSLILLLRCDWTMFSAYMSTNSAYEFKNVPAHPGGYYVIGIDLDAEFNPVIEGPVFPV